MAPCRSAFRLHPLNPALHACWLAAGLAVRVPLINSSITDCVFEVKRGTSAEEVNALLKEASQTYLKGILGFEERPLVSTDYINDTRSGIVDALSTQVSAGLALSTFTARRHHPLAERGSWCPSLPVAWGGPQRALPSCPAS